MSELLLPDAHRIILAAVRTTRPVAASVAVFPERGDTATLTAAHNLAPPSIPFYIARGSGIVDVQSLERIQAPRQSIGLRTSGLYFLQSNEPDEQTPAAWLADHITRSWREKEVVIVAPRHSLPDVYMSVLWEVLKHYRMRSPEDCRQLPTMFPYISPVNSPNSQSTGVRSRLVNHEQLVEYLKMKGL